MDMRLLLLMILNVWQVFTAELLLRLPGIETDGTYRLHYSPPIGSPAVNTTIQASQFVNGFNLTSLIPGTDYKLTLYFTNLTVKDWPSFQATVTTSPDPPTNLTVQNKDGSSATVRWWPPIVGGYDMFRIKVTKMNVSTPFISKDTRQNSTVLEDLIPGATYRIDLYTLYKEKESQLYVSTNITTLPNPPGRFIVWFRNETTLLVLWQGPFPVGEFTHYQVLISPPDARKSVQTIRKDDTAVGQGAFNGLVPGRVYNVSVRTVTNSGQMSSRDTVAQYRTVPLRPANLTFHNVSPRGFTVRWRDTPGKSEFDHYRISLVEGKTRNETMSVERAETKLVERGETMSADFSDLDPDTVYNVTVKTVSESVASWPTTGQVTTLSLQTDQLEESV